MERVPRCSQSSCRAPSVHTCDLGWVSDSQSRGGAFADPFRGGISILFSFVFINPGPRALARARHVLFVLASVVTHVFFSASVFQWKLVCDSAWKVHIAKFSLLVGSIFGYLVMGVMADW